MIQPADALTNLTPAQRRILERLRAGGALFRDHARGGRIGDRNIVYRWNELDPPVSEVLVRKLVDAGLASGYEEVVATPAPEPAAAKDNDPSR